MFSPNLMGKIKKVTGRDIHGRQSLSDPISCPFGPVSLKLGSGKTSVRADSSASRGAADQIAIERGSILIPRYIPANISDIFAFGENEYEITAIHPRYSVDGMLDHYECDLETFLG